MLTKAQKTRHFCIQEHEAHMETNSKDVIELKYLNQELKYFS